MTEKKLDQDTLQRFIFEKYNIRGIFVHLNATYQAALQNHTYNLTTSKLLGETLCATALLASTIKFKGKFTLQIQGKGPLRVLLGQTNDQAHLRGLALYEGKLQGGFNKLIGDGLLLINVSPDDAKERYQAVTNITGQSIANTIEHYFDQSEQLATRIWLFADKTQAAGLLLQNMPGESVHSNFWEHVTILADTLKATELLNLSNQTVLHRLFHEEDIRIFEREPLCFRCQCSTEKMEDALIQLGKKEIDEIIHEEGCVKVTCDFCNREYRFDQVDIARLFSDGNIITSPEQKQ